MSSVALRLDRAFPWGVEGGVRSTGLSAACGVGLVISWFGVSGEGLFVDQVVWLNAAVGLVLVALYSNVSLVLRGRRAVGDRRVRLLSDGLLELHVAALSSPMTVDDRASADRRDPGSVLVARGLTLFHRQGCPMIRDRDVRPVTIATARSRSLQPCGICLEAAEVPA